MIKHNFLTSLKQSGLITVSGVDAARFLQGQLTCDIHEVNDEKSALSAYCDNKGRVQAICWVFQSQDEYYLSLPDSIIPTMLPLLQKYAIFSKVTLADATHLVPKKEVLNSEGSWRLEDIKAGIPQVYPATVGEFTPHALNLQELNAISFTKGCYLGQEIVARMHYLGKLKQRMYVTRIIFFPEAGSSDISPGDKFYNEDNQLIITIVDAYPIGNNQYAALGIMLKQHAETKTIRLKNLEIKIDE